MQDFVTAAELHVLAAAAGDAVALGNLSDYRNDLHKIALGGNPSASLSLATIYDQGLVVEKDEATALAWLRWGRGYCTQDAADHVRRDLEQMESVYSATASAAVKMRADDLLMEMNSAREASSQL